MFLKTDSDVKDYLTQKICFWVLWQPCPFSSKQLLNARLSSIFIEIPYPLMFWQIALPFHS